LRPLYQAVDKPSLPWSTGGKLPGKEKHSADRGKESWIRAKEEARVRHGHLSPKLKGRRGRYLVAGKKKKKKKKPSRTKPGRQRGSAGV